MSASEIIAEVQAALREAGVDAGSGPLVAVLQPTLTGGNPWDAPGATPSPVDVVVVVDMFRRDEIDGARVLSGDKKLLVEAGVVVPKVGDMITVSGLAHRIEGVNPLAPGGVDLMYEVQAREV